MSPIKAVRVFYFIAFLGAIAIFSLLLKSQSGLVEAALYIWIAVLSIVIWRIRCPRCDTPVARIGKLVGVPIFSIFGSKKCSGCGLDLTKIYPPGQDI